MGNPSANEISWMEPGATQRPVRLTSQINRNLTELTPA